MSEELDARLLRGTLSTVHKALQAAGFDGSQALDLYAPIAVPVIHDEPSVSEAALDEPDDNDDKVVAFTGFTGGEKPGASGFESTEVGIEPGAGEAPDGDRYTDQTAAELFGSMPWDSNESSEKADTSEVAADLAATQNDEDQTSLDESAEALFSSSVWESVSSGASSDQTADAASAPASEASDTDLSTEETAEELFAAMPWESNASRSPSGRAEGPTQSGEAAGDENEAGTFLLDMPWEESSQPAEEAAARAHSKQATNSGRNDADAQDFFENLDWDGAAKPAENPNEPDVPEAPEAQPRDEHVSIDPGAGEDLPEHVLRIMGMRESEQVPTPTDDAVRRSELAGDSDSSDEYDPFNGDNP